MIQVTIKLPDNEYRMIRIINDGTGTSKRGNYLVEAWVGSDEGTQSGLEPRYITQFQRSNGWAKLVQLALEGMR